MTTVDPTDIRGLVTARLHFVVELPHSNYAVCSTLWVEPSRMTRGFSGPAADLLHFVFRNHGCVTDQTLTWACWGGVAGMTSRAIAHTKPTSSRATAVVTLHFSLPPRFKCR